PPLDSTLAPRFDKRKLNTPLAARKPPIHAREGYPMRPPTRRHFLQDSAALAAGFAALPQAGAQADEPGDVKPAGPNEVLRVAVCGVHSRGLEHIQGWGKLRNDVRITTICDVDLNVTGKAAKAVEHYTKNEPKVVQDIRRVLDDKSIDVISIATPNHWHA